MADGKPPTPPPLSPHEKGENPNTKSMLHSQNRSTKTPDLHIPSSDQHFVIIGSQKILLNQGSSNDVTTNRPSVIGLKLSHFASSSMMLPLNYQETPKVVFQKSDKAKLLAGMKHVLIAKFSHGRPSVLMMKNFLSNRKLIGNTHVSIFDAKHIFIEFEMFEDFVRFWIKQNGIINGYPVRFFKWDESFDPNKESSIVPVWIHLPQLPLYLFEEGALLLIASALGRPLHLDGNNLNRNKISYATICIEFDILKAPPSEIWIQFGEGPSAGNHSGSYDGFRQKIVYGFMPPFCSGCCHLGHLSSDCKRITKVPVRDALPVFSVMARDGLNNGVAKKLLMVHSGLVESTSVEQDVHILEEGELDESLEHVANRCYNKEEQGRVDEISKSAGGCAGEFATRELADGVSDAGRLATSLHLAAGGSGTADVTAAAAADVAENALDLTEQHTAVQNLEQVEQVNSVEQVVKAVMVEQVQMVEEAEQNVAVYTTYPATGQIVQELEVISSGQEKVAQVDIAANEGLVLGTNKLSCSTTQDQLQGVLKQHLEVKIKGEHQPTYAAEDEVNGYDKSMDQLTGMFVQAASRGCRILGQQQVQFQNAEERMGSNFVASTEQEHQTTRAVLVEKEAVSVQPVQGLQEQPSGAATSPNQVAESVAASCNSSPAAGSHGARECAVAGESAAQDVILQHFEDRNEEQYVQTEELVCTSTKHESKGCDTETENSLEQLYSEKTLQIHTRPVMESLWEQLKKVKQGNIKKIKKVNKGKRATKKDLGEVGMGSKNDSVCARKEGDEQGDFVEEQVVQQNREPTPKIIVSPRKLSSAAAEFTPKCASSARHVAMVTNNDLEQLKERLLRLKGDSIPAPASPWVPPNMSKHLARELKKFRKQHRINQNWQDIEDYSDEDSEEEDLEEKAGTRVLNGNAFLSDEMGDIPRPFKIKSAPNSPKGRNSSYDSNTYLLSRGLF